MNDELLLEKLDSYHHKLTDDAAARIRAQAARIAELEAQIDALLLLLYPQPALRAAEKEEGNV